MIDVPRKIVRRLYAMSFRKRVATSLSDNQAYPQVCINAATNYARFNRFRRHPIYNQILEHVTPREGEQYLAIIRRDPEVLAAMEEFKRNDRHGGPRVYSYPGVGVVSPTTLRYVKVLCDLKRHFGTLDGLRICEIGVGYGGQCRILNACFKPRAYRLVDIQPALWLAQRFLDHYVIAAPLSYLTMNELEASDYDLVISNYAFAELPRDIQDVYLEKVIRRSPRGYVTYNEITPESFQTYTTDAFVAMIGGAKRLPEEPLSHPGNSLVVWGDQTTGC